MTTTAWRAPARSTRDWHRPITDREAVIEDMLRIGSVDGDETEAAFRVLRYVTKLCDTELCGRIEELLDLAQEAAFAETHLGRGGFGDAVDRYCDALWRLANGPDDMYALVDAVQGPAHTIAALDARPKLGLVTS